MSKRFSMSWWSSLGWRKRAEAPENDFADMGTAFGLDASMEAFAAPEDAFRQEAEAGPLPSLSIT